MKSFWRKVYKIFYNIFYSLPFAMKAGDELMTTNKGVSTSINQHKQNKSVWQDIMDVKVTEEVQALRWETFKAEEKSNEYEYIANGIADKKEGKFKDGAVWNLYKFRQSNIELDYGYNEALHEFVNNDIYNLPKRTLLTAEYKGCPKFRLEKYVENIYVNITDNTHNFSLEFVINEHPLDVLERQFNQYITKMYNEWEIIKDNKSSHKAFFEKYGIIEDLDRIKFTTYRATNNVPNGVTYDFRGIDILGMDKLDKSIFINCIGYTFEGARLLSEQFKASEEVMNKFENKEKRENIVVKMGENKAYCEKCGKPMNYYDHHILIESGKRALCIDCIKKENLV